MAAIQPAHLGRAFPLIPFQFDTRRLMAVKHEDDLWFTGEDVGAALEYTTPRDAINKIFRRNEAELSSYSAVLKLPTSSSVSTPNLSGCGDSLSPQVGSAGSEDVAAGTEDLPPGTESQVSPAVQLRPVRVFNEEGVMILTMLSQQPKAAAFRAWAVKILKAYRHGQLVLQNPANRERLLETCIKEARFGNEAALHTLIAHFGYPETIRLPAAPAPGVLALQQPALVAWFWRELLPKLATDIRAGYGPVVDEFKRRRPHWRGWKIVPESGAAFALDHRSGDLHELVAELGARDGVQSAMTGHLFGRWLNQIESLLNTQGWTRRQERTVQGSQIYRLMLVDVEG
ncbi:MAG: hypothetical protein H7A16_09600 [Sinobacteraceae bacterium]|nr:hypothetical protein [Nevskiaceae bacterium]